MHWHSIKKHTAKGLCMTCEGLSAVESYSAILLDLCYLISA